MYLLPGRDPHDGRRAVDGLWSAWKDLVELALLDRPHHRIMRDARVRVSTHRILRNHVDKVEVANRVLGDAVGERYWGEPGQAIVRDLRSAPDQPGLFRALLSCRTRQRSWGGEGAARCRETARSWSSLRRCFATETSLQASLP